MHFVLWERKEQVWRGFCVWRVFICSEREQEADVDAGIPSKGFHYSFDYFAAARDKEFAVVIHLFPSQGEDSVLTANIN